MNIIEIASDGIFGRLSQTRLWVEVLRFRLMIVVIVLTKPQASDGEAQHEALCRTGRLGQRDIGMHRG